MKTEWAIAVLVLSTGLHAQSAPPPCPADRPIDDIIQDIHKEQSNKRNRNKDPRPQIVCTPGLCNDGQITTPPTLPEPAPQVELPNKTTGKISSDPTPPPTSKPGPAEECATAMNMAVEAAHDVEVGDYYFERKKYSAALQRYNDAAEEKPKDLAIHIRLGRTFEKLGQLAHAIQEYQAGTKLSGPQKWSDEAKSALTRLQPAKGS